MADLIAFAEAETLLVDDLLFSNNAVEQYLGRTDKSLKMGTAKYFVTLSEKKTTWSKCSQDDLCARRFMVLMLATDIRRWKLETEGSF